MSYVSLYRKWRSQNFDELVGQEVIVQTLKNAIKNNRLAHAYLFSGPRGTGKTSTARILAKALNCKEGSTPSPCGKCENCSKIRTGHSVDVIEIDAASNRGIDEIRDLRERVRYAPLEGRYKVYIIDEVHMLTQEAFNALLKTLEEPPSHTIFVLATTELQKVPMTIASRCQRLDFGRIKLPELKLQLKKIADNEGFEIEEKAVELIARQAEGAMRDAISLLDQLVSFSGSKITQDGVITLLGTVDEELLFSFGESLAGNDMKTALELVKKAVEEGRSIPQVTRDLVFHFRGLLHLKLGSSESLELTDERIENLAEQAAKFSLSRIKEILSLLSRAEMDMKWHPYPRLVLEVALVDIAANTLPANSPAQIADPAKPDPIKENQNIIEQIVRVDEPAKRPVLDPRILKIKDHWQKILDGMKKKSVFGFVSLHEGEPLEINSRGELVISFKKGYSFHKERLEETKNKALLEEAIREAIGESIPILCIIGEGAKKPALSLKTVAEFFEGRIV